MSTPVSATDIANLAMDMINTQTVSDIEMPGTDEIAATLNRWYDVVREQCLETLPWAFASTRDELPLQATAPKFGYTDSYKLPTDYLAITFIDDEQYPLDYWDYQIEGRSLYIDNSSAVSLDVGYVQNLTDVSKFSASFKMYLASKLAFFVAKRLTGDPNSAKNLQAVMKEAMIEAKAQNGRINPPRAYRNSRMLDGRKLYQG